MAKAFVIDVSKCSGCYCCQMACKDEHCGNDWTPYAKPQPDIGQFWLKLEDKVQGTTPKVKIHYIPHLCNHCDNPACVKAARDGAVYKREDGLVIIDPEKAKGQKQIAEACPYGAIYWNEELDIAQKCTGCAHLLDNGFEKPRCVENCPTDALQFGEESELQDLIIGSEVLMPETACQPRVYYRNVPGQFVAGTVYDPVAKEVVIGARCLLLNGNKLWETFTDGYGDFWFKDLPKGKYDLTIEADGFELKVIEAINAQQECANLGEIALDAKK